MTTHLRTDQIDAAVAGLEIDAEGRKHLATCVQCRTEAAEFGRLIESRREQLAADEPDWAAQTEKIMGRIPGEVEAMDRRRPGWMRPVLAVAAVVVMAVGIGVLRWDRPVEPPVDEVAVDEILAEMDELLSDDSIPGFEIIDPETDDLASYFDNGAS
jgi:anti-sigma factor RsiW